MDYWTPMDKQKLKDLWAAGWSARAIAFEFVGRSRNAIIGVTHRMGLAAQVKRVKQPVHFITHKEPRKPRVRLPPQLSPTPELPLEAPEMSSCAVGFMELKDHHCRAVIAIHSEENGLAVYCGAPKYEDRYGEKSWCYHHFRQFTLRR